MIGQVDRFICRCDSCGTNLTIEQSSITKFFDDLELEGWWIDRASRRAHCPACVKIVWKVGKNCLHVLQGTEPEGEAT